MAQTRKDHVNVFKNFFAMCFIGFGVFMSTDFIRLLVFDTIKDNMNWINVYQIMLWCVVVSAMFVKMPAAASLRYCLRFNTFFLCLAALLFHMKWLETMSFTIILVMWAYILGVAIVNALVLASYHYSGVKGLVVGVMFSFLLTYSILYIMDRIQWYKREINNYRYIILIFIVFKAAINLGAMYVLSSATKEHHLNSYDEAFKHLTSGVMLEWLSGALHERDVQLSLHEVVPQCVTPMIGLKEIFKCSRVITVWFMFIALSFTCSLFTPYIGVTNWDLSYFVIDKLERAEHLGKLLGVLIACLRRKRRNTIVWMGLCYMVHVGISVFLTCFVHSYKVSKKISINVAFSLSAFNAVLGGFLTVSSFTEFFRTLFDISCTGPKQQDDGDYAQCCMDELSDACFCTEKFCKEKCGKDPFSHTSSSERKNQIFIAPNALEMYNRWDESHCLKCWMYRHNPDEVCKTAEKNKVCNDKEAECFLLRNCKVSVCTYCDMNLLLECVKIECTCVKDECSIPLPNANLFKEDSEYKTAQKKKELEEKINKGKSKEPRPSCIKPVDLKPIEETTDEKPIEIPLHELTFNNGAISLVTTSSSDFVIQASACCPKNNDDKKNEHAAQHFDIASICTYSCCHYDLKVLLKCKDMNGPINMMKAPYPGKFNPLSAIVFNGKCTAQNDHENEIKCIEPKSHTVLEAREVKESLKYACSNSKVISISRIASDEHDVGDNGLALCCNAAKQAAEKKKGESSSSDADTSNVSAPECCHMKVLPTAYPFHFRKKDLLRFSIVSAFLIVILIYALAKICAITLFAILDYNYGLDLSTSYRLVEPFYEQSENYALYMPEATMDDQSLLDLFQREMNQATQKANIFSSLQSNVVSFKQNEKPIQESMSGLINGTDLVSTDEVGIKTVDSGNQTTKETPEPGTKSAKPKDKKEEEEDIDNDEDEEEEETEGDSQDEHKKYKPLVAFEKKEMHKVLKNYKMICNELEYAYLMHWTSEMTALKNKDPPVDKIKRIRRLKWCLESGLKEYALNSAVSIINYLNSTDEKWDIEWTQYRHEVEQKLKLNDELDSLTASSEISFVNPGLQSAIDAARKENWNDIVTSAQKLLSNAEKLKIKIDELNQARGGAQALNKTVELWTLRLEIIEQLTNEGIVYLGWGAFLKTWEKILDWQKNFLELYYKEYKNIMPFYPEAKPQVAQAALGCRAA
ncbi:putative integral membrane protein [Babesia bovis T2Bo]|uniref:Uncharacterized protein n=1 Tax=Babesia bovis TaxID=5865 RepID=A7ARZ7_BABBO|nr:putative integral membrane protein [Babesia bovis T2Bo]EDO07316.1 putative integral membrane protein [Babesia bovis T2Bo]|eukprot:XP_001610884.1 hypothetical protein [Babesia bovis T2Bo]